MKKTLRIARRSAALLLALTLLCAPLPASAAEAEDPLTPAEAVAEMTWGANPTDLFIADVDYSHGNTAGYYENAPFGIAVWFWNNNFEWMSYIEHHSGTYTAEVKIPNHSGVDDIEPWIGGLFHLGLASYTPDQRVNVSFSGSKIVKANGDEIALSFLDGEYDGITSNVNYDNGVCHYNLPMDKSKLPTPSADLDGAVFRTTVTVEEAPFLSPEAKAEHFYQLGRYPMDYKELIDLFLAEGANVFRLPITWTSFMQNEHPYTIDTCWFERVQEVVDYILDSGAYCIINMHNDYLQRSFVYGPDSRLLYDENGRNGVNANSLPHYYHWDELWMYPEYDSYVNARFAAAWEQIATYFKDYPDHLIFEPCNEPSMDYYGYPDDHYMTQISRTNELNQIFVETVRATGGKNKTRLLSLAVANYNRCECLNSYNVSLPEDDYIMMQLHSYSEMEENNPGGSYNPSYDYRAETDQMFDTVDEWKSLYPNIPVIVGEVGITHRASDEVLAPIVAYYFQRAAQSGVPCLWWEDFFKLESGYQYWLYEKDEMRWGRPNILAAIRSAVNAPTLRVKLTAGGREHWLSGSIEGACTVLAALYDENGRLLEMQTAERSGNECLLSLAFSSADLPENYTVKAFLLDENYRPLAEALG